MKQFYLFDKPELLIYYKDYKFPTLYGIIQEEPTLIMIDEDGENIFYPKSIGDMVEFDKSIQDELEFERFEVKLREMSK